MPKAIEEKLRLRAKELLKKGKLRRAGESPKKAEDRYVYGSDIMQKYLSKK